MFIVSIVYIIKYKLIIIKFMEDYKFVGEKRTFRADVNVASFFIFVSVLVFMFCVVVIIVGLLLVFSMMIVVLIFGREMYVGLS